MVDSPIRAGDARPGPPLQALTTSWCSARNRCPLRPGRSVELRRRMGSRSDGAGRQRLRRRRSGGSAPRRVGHHDRLCGKVTTSAGDRISTKRWCSRRARTLRATRRGADNARAFIHRTLGDLDAIRVAARAAGPGAPGLVVGGGLLEPGGRQRPSPAGHDAAHRGFAPRLMPLHPGRRGWRCGTPTWSPVGAVRCTPGVSTTAIADDAGTGMLAVTLSDGTVLDATLVVFSAGSARRTRWRTAGLQVGERGGVVVDTACRTSEPGVYAIGEVAAVEAAATAWWHRLHDGRDRRRADPRARSDARFPGADMSTKLKLLGVDVASLGDAMAATPVRWIVRSRSGGRHLKETRGLPMTRGPCSASWSVTPGPTRPSQPLCGPGDPADPSALICGGEPGPGLAKLPDDAEICSLQRRFEGDPSAGAIAEGACTVADIKKYTTAGNHLRQLRTPASQTVGRLRCGTLGESLCDTSPQSRRVVLDRGHHRHSPSVSCSPVRHRPGM